MDEKDRTKLKSEIMSGSMSAELLAFVVRKMGVAALNDEALRRAAELTRALEHELELEGPELELE